MSRKYTDNDMSEKKKTKDEKKKTKPTKQRIGKYNNVFLLASRNVCQVFPIIVISQNVNFKK